MATIPTISLYVKLLADKTPEDQEKSIKRLVELIKCSLSDLEAGNKLRYVRRTLSLNGFGHLVDFAKDSKLTTLVNDHQESKLEEKAPLAIPDQFSTVEKIKKILNTPPTDAKSRRLYLYATMIAGCFRPVEIGTIEIYKKGAHYYTSTQAKGKQRETQVFSIIRIPDLIEHLERCRQYINNKDVPDPVSRTGKRQILRDIELNHKDLRAIGSFLYSEKPTVKDTVLATSRVLRHAKKRVGSFMYYSHVKK